jgi:hypothetical protein
LAIVAKVSPLARRAGNDFDLGQIAEIKEKGRLKTAA